MSWNVPTTVATGGSLSSANWNDVALNMADSGWIAVPNGSMSGGWVNGSPAFAYRLIGNVVRLRGLLTTGTSNVTALILPAGYRPPTTGVYSSIQGVNLSFTTITTAGAVIPVYTGLAQMYFDGITFTID